MKLPAWQPSALLLVLALFIFTNLAPSLEAADKNLDASKTEKSKSSKAKSSKGKTTTEPTTEPTAQDGLGAMGDMIPEGMRNLKVRIPGFQAGRQSSLITADAVTRQKDHTLFAEKMAIHMFAVKPEENVRVDLRTATYNMTTQVLTSEERSRVSRKDFQIEGDSMVFDTTTSQGKMVGRVRMIIYDAKSFSQAVQGSTDPTEAPAVPPVTTTTPDQPKPAPQNAQ